MLITSFSQIQGNPTLFAAYNLLDPRTKISVDAMIDKNMRASEMGDPKLFHDLWVRANLQPGDKDRIEFFKQVMDDPANLSRLSVPQLRELQLEINRSTTIGGRSYSQLRTSGDHTADQYFRAVFSGPNFMAQKTLNPEAYIDWKNRWNEEVGKKIDEYANAGQYGKIRQMFMSGNPESVIDAKYLQTFVGKPEGMQATAQQVAAGQQQPVAAQTVKPAEMPKTIKTDAELDAWLKTLPPGVTTFTVNGKTMRVPVATPTSTEAAPAPAREPVLMNEAGKLETPAAPAMPQLVTKLTRAKSDQNFPTWMDVGTGAVKAVKQVEAAREKVVQKAGAALETGVDASVRAASATGEAVISGATRAGEAVTPPSDQEKAAMAFRQFVRIGQYTRASAPTIQQAIASGLLTGVELQIARGMLREIGR
jgi:hypothetical protein